MLMRDEKEGRKRSYKQQGKATQHTHTHIYTYNILCMYTICEYTSFISRLPSMCMQLLTNGKRKKKKKMQRSSITCNDCTRTEGNLGTRLHVCIHVYTCTCTCSRVCNVCEVVPIHNRHINYTCGGGMSYIVVRVGRQAREGLSTCICSTEAGRGKRSERRRV